MTSRDAERYVYRVLAQTLQCDFDNDSGWLHEHPNSLGSKPLSDADADRVYSAAKRIMDRLRKKGSVDDA